MNFTLAFHFSRRTVFSAFLASAMLCHAAPASAVSSDENALIEGAKLCTRYLPRHERQYGIPEHLLAAIASTESGRFHRGLGLNLPWPWTINVNGRGYFFDTKEEAVATVNKLRAEGYQSIDVGCMQVNLHHHPHAFASVEQAFDPAYNVGYAASFLKTNFMEEGSWRKATGDYHSRTASYGSQYADQVFGTWGRIVAKVADARAGRPVLNDYAKNSGSKQLAMASHFVRPSSSYHAPHMRLVSVSSRDKTSTRENGVLVIRPKKDDSDIVVMSAPDPAYENKSAAKTSTSSSANAVHIGRASESDMQAFKASSTPVANGIKISLGDGAKANNGQFQPSAHAANVVNTLASETPATATKANRLFVFDN